MKDNQPKTKTKRRGKREKNRKRQEEKKSFQRKGNEMMGVHLAETVV